MRPDVEGLIGHLEEAEDAGSGGTLWVSVAKEDALLMEHLWHLVYAEQPGELQAQHLDTRLGRAVEVTSALQQGPLRLLTYQGYQGSLPEF